MPRGLLGAVGAAAVAGASVAGCSSPKAATVTTVSPPASSVPSSSSSSTTTSTTTPSTLSHCQASGMSGAVEGTEGAAGTVEVTVKMVNDGAAPCALDGYPGLQLLSSTGAELTTDVVRGGAYSFTDLPPSPITVPAGAAAYFNLAYSDVPSASGSCSAAASMWVTPPDDVDHLTVTQSLTACSGGTLTVSPVFTAGSPQTQTTAP